MFPWVYEFRWSTGHLIFLGVFFTVVIVVTSTFAIALVRTYRDFKKRRAETIQWEAEFEDLPVLARACRHELTGEVTHRTCTHEFDCRSCKTHPTFLARRSSTDSTSQDESMYGFTMPLDRLYHRGHTWVKKDENGTCLVGLDDFGGRLIGKPDALELPAVGSRIQANGTGWFVTKSNARLRILSPIDGLVVEHGNPERGWFLRVRAEESDESTGHLLRGEEIRPWIMREMERLQTSLSTDGLGMSLADGGELVQDVWKQNSKVDWDGVLGEVFLQA